MMPKIQFLKSSVKGHMRGGFWVNPRPDIPKVENPDSTGKAEQPLVVVFLRPRK